MILRDATPDDLPALSELKRKAAWSNESDRPLLQDNPDLASTIEDGLDLRVLDVNGSICAFIGTRAVPGGQEIVELFTDPAHMRMGFAARLVREAMARTAGPLVVDANHAALGFYRAMGFVQTGKGGGDGVAMEWRA